MTATSVGQERHNGSFGGRQVVPRCFVDETESLLRVDRYGLLSSESYAEYVAGLPDGVAAVGFDDLVECCDEVALRGRGGAGFSTSAKLRAVRDVSVAHGSAACVVANGDEGEPASAKDRYLLAYRPHLVLDGLLLAATALQADRAYLYLTDDRLVGRLRAAAECWGDSVPVEVFCLPPGYVSGEETAVVRALSGGDAKPTVKPPRPFSAGVHGRPTFVSNVETLAHLARAVRLGATRVCAQGTATDPGTGLVTVVPDEGQAYVAEVPFGVTVRVLLEELGLAHADAPPRALLTSGFFGGFLPEPLWDTPIGHASMRAAGTSLGCGAFLVLRSACPVGVAAELLDYFDRENAKQCGVCINGVSAMAQALTRVSTGEALETDLANLDRWSAGLPGRGDCALLDGAAKVVSSLLCHFRGALVEHLERACADCGRAAGHRSPRTRFEVCVEIPDGGST